MHLRFQLSFMVGFFGCYGFNTVATLEGRGA